jgi:hypothetical protein
MLNENALRDFLQHLFAAVFWHRSHHNKSSLAWKMLVPERFHTRNSTLLDKIAICKGRKIPYDTVDLS